MSVINLWDETSAALKKRGISQSAIKYVLNKEGFIEMGEFAMVSSGYWYDNEGESIGVDPTLKIVGNNWWLERKCIDGKEGWTFRRKPLRPTVQSPTFRPDMNRIDGSELLSDQLENPE